MTARTRALIAALTALACAVALAACGEKDESLGSNELESFTVMLDFFPNADHAGIYAAEGQGHFEDAGLDVKIRQPPSPNSPIAEVAAGRVDLSISYEPEVLLAREKGVAVTAVGAVVQKPLTSIISLPRAKIRSPKDLEGKRVGTAGIPYQDAFLRTILLEAEVDPDTVKTRNIGFEFSSNLVAKKIDAALGAYWNYEGVQLALKKKRPRIIKVDDAGVPTYNELVLVANSDALKRDEDKLRAFITALARGTRDLEKDPETGIAPLLRANPDLDPDLQRASVKVTLPLFLPPAGKPYGYQSPQEWRDFTGWMRENQLLKNVQDPAGVFTNELLPGA